MEGGFYICVTVLLYASNQSEYIMKEIVINRMFTGKYLRDNIGHEVINLFQADNGKYYVYLNDDGQIGKEHFDANGNCTIDKMLLAHTLEGTNAVEIIGLATGLHPVYDPSLDERGQKATQKEFAEKDNVSYGGAAINAIFRGSEQQTVTITFEAEKVCKVADGKRIYLKMADKQNQEYKDLEVYESDKVVVLSDVKLGQGLRSYVAEGEADYAKLSDIVNDASLWGDPMPKVNEKDAPAELSYMDICQRSYDELAYSNAIAYFAKKYPELAYLFYEQISGVKPAFGHRPFVVRREENHIDLLFYNSGNLVVVENKIKSDLNGVERDQEGKIVKTQLDDYYEAAKELVEKNKINCVRPYFFIFAPDYSPLKHYFENHLDLSQYTKHIRVGKHFDLVFYSELYGFLLPYLDKKPYGKDVLFVQFVKSLERHTHPYDDGLYETTVRRFYERCQTVVATKPGQFR